MENKGTWIVLEGPDGTGTTTITRLLAGKIFDADKMHTPMLAREPTMREHGKRARKLMKNPQMNIDTTGEMLCQLFVLDRYDVMDNVICPNLRQGIPVVQDRGMYSTLAYQGAQGIPHERIIEMHKDMLIIPDAVIIFDVAIQEALRRLNERNDAKEAFDQDSFQYKVHEAYKALPDVMRRLLPDHPLHVIDANGSIEDVLEKCWKIVDPLLPYNRNN